MGFGSYDESEQKNQDVDTDDDEAVSVHENDHDGEVSFETDDMSTSELIDQLPETDDNE